MNERDELMNATDTELMEWAQRRLGWTKHKLRTYLIGSSEWGFNLPNSPHETMAKFLSDVGHEEFIQAFLRLTGKTSEEFRRVFIDFVLDTVEKAKEIVEEKDKRTLVFYGSLGRRDKANAELLKDALRHRNISFNEEMGSDMDGTPELRIYVDKDDGRRARTLMRYAFARRDTFNSWTIILAITTCVCVLAMAVFPEGAMVFKALSIWAFMVTGVLFLASMTLGRTGKDLPDDLDDYYYD